MAYGNPEVQCRIHKGSPKIPILSQINPIPRTDNNFFEIQSNIVLPSMPMPLERPRRRWEDNIITDLEEIGINTRNWVDLAQDRDFW